tara:strand:- start:594 stop:1184 length:591 start_codon:yes stop_codon:yes gene_type:complete
MKTNTKITMKKPTKKDIAMVLKKGCELSNDMKKITDVIKADLHHRDSNGQTQLTKAFDNIMKGKDEEVKQKSKAFIRKQFQTLVKEKTTQFAILGDDSETTTVTVKKVNKPMLEDEKILEDNNFTADDLGSYRAVIIRKEVNDLGLAQELCKWMRSKKSDGLFTGTKDNAGDLKAYDLNGLKFVIDQLEKGIELPV